MNPQALYPYLVARLPDPAWEPAAVPVGHGLYAVLFEDAESDVTNTHTPVGPDELRAAGLSADEAHRLALDNLTRFADDDPRLSIQVLGRPGDAVHLLLYSDHPRAAGCLRLPDLYDQARELLEADDLCACVPQGESLVVFPKRDQKYRAMLVEKLRAAEADAREVLSFELFELTAGGVKPL